MIDEVEALVGYVFVVGGRAVGATPPGALVELPPRKAQRSREQDTFFTLITPAGASHAQAALYERMAHLAAEVYFRSGGSVTSGLREAIHAVNTHLIGHNESTGQGCAVGVICLALRGHEIFAARAGSCLYTLRRSGEFRRYPDTPSDLAEVMQPGLGTPLDIKLSHHEVAPGNVLLLSDLGLAQTDQDLLRDALDEGSIPAIIEALKPLSSPHTQAMVIEFVSTDTPDPDVTPSRASVRLPAAVSVPAGAPPVSGAATTAGDGAVDLPVASDADAAASEALAQADAESEAATGEPRPVTQRAMRGLGRALGKIARGLGFALDRVLPEADEETGPRIPAMLAAALAILVPVVVVFVVVALRLSQFDLTQFEQQVQEVQEAEAQAEMISLDDAERARLAWLAVLQRVELVETTTGRTNDPDLARIRAKAQGILDKFDKVTRRAPVALRNFGQGARLARPVIRGGADLYTLDLSQSAIYRDTLNPSATALLTRNAQPVVQRGQAVGAYSVRELVDIIWMAEGGVQRANVLTALDTQGILVSYSPTFAPATSQRLPGADLWVRPTRLSTWRGRLYLLDPGANQIWRYVHMANSYPNPPEPYFTGEDRPDLSDAVDFGIDVQGNVYVLFADGTLKKYTTGVEQLFALTGLPDANGISSASAMHIDVDSPLPAIYITDPQDQSIYQVTLSGSFRYRFRATDPNAFRQLSGIYADGDDVYVTSGSMLYYFSIVDLVDIPSR